MGVAPTTEPTESTETTMVSEATVIFQETSFEQKQKIASVSVQDYFAQKMALLNQEGINLSEDAARVDQVKIKEKKEKSKEKKSKKDKNDKKKKKSC